MLITTLLYDLQKWQKMCTKHNNDVGLKNRYSNVVPIAIIDILAFTFSDSNMNIKMYVDP